MTARELIARRARVLKIQVCFAIGGFLAIGVLQFVPTRLDMVKTAFAVGGGAGHTLTGFVSGWWPWLFLPVVAYLLGAAATAVLTGNLIWPLNWVAALAFRGVDFDEPCARHDGHTVHDDVFTPDDCGPGCLDEDRCSVCGGDHDRSSRDDAPDCYDATHGEAEKRWPCSNCGTSDAACIEQARRSEGWCCDVCRTAVTHEAAR